MVDNDAVPMPTVEELPKIWLRLAKRIPAICKILADKGFIGTERDYPWMNQVVTPTKLSAAKGYRKAPGHIKRDRPLTSSRFSAETVFKRIYDEDILGRKIPYGTTSSLSCHMRIPWLTAKLIFTSPFALLARILSLATIIGRTQRTIPGSTAK